MPSEFSPTEPIPEKRSSGGNGLLTMRVLGWLMFVYGGVMLVLLFTPAKQWALDHSIAALVSATDKRANNSIQGSVDDPIAYAGSAVVMFAGLWFALLVPWVLTRSQKKQLAQASE